MSIFITPQDYITMPNECAQLSTTICNHQYKMWCKKDKVEQAEIIIERITPIIDKISSKYQGIGFDKVLIMAIIDILSKDKEYKIENKEDNIPIQNENEFEQEKKDLINDFMQILMEIKSELEK